MSLLTNDKEYSTDFILLIGLTQGMNYTKIKDMTKFCHVEFANVGASMQEDNQYYPLSDSVGQLPHQFTYTQNGNTVDHDDYKVSVVDSDGTVVLSEDEEQLKKFIKESISVDNLISTFKESAHITLLKLLALQDNQHPLKKGGPGIAYRTDVLIMNCKMNFTAEENIVFDAILGTVSSNPETETFKISPATFQKHTRYSTDKYIYQVFKKGAGRLSDRHLIFESGKDEDPIKIPWFDILRYHKGNKNDHDAYIEFVPTDFFRDMVLCSQIVHGAYGALEVTSQLQGKYTIALYWFFENKKNYKDYPGATTGTFRMTIDDLKYQFSMPVSYMPSDIERRALNPARDSINSIPECDFTWDYSKKKVNGVVVYTFSIQSKMYIETKPTEIAIEEPSEKLFKDIKNLLSASGFEFDNSQILTVYNAAVKNNRDFMFMMQVILAFKQRLENPSLEPVEEKALVSYLCKMIEMGFEKKSNTKTNGFNQPSAHNDSLNNIEELLLDN